MGGRLCNRLIARYCRIDDIRVAWFVVVVMHHFFVHFLNEDILLMNIIRGVRRWRSINCARGTVNDFNIQLLLVTIWIVSRYAGTCCNETKTKTKTVMKSNDKPNWLFSQKKCETLRKNAKLWEEKSSQKQHNLISTLDPFNTVNSYQCQDVVWCVCRHFEWICALAAVQLSNWSSFALGD